MGNSGILLGGGVIDLRTVKDMREGGVRNWGKVVTSFMDEPFLNHICFNPNVHDVMINRDTLSVVIGSLLLILHVGPRKSLLVCQAGLSSALAVLSLNSGRPWIRPRPFCMKKRQKRSCQD